MCFKLYESNGFWVEIKANLYKQCNRALIIWKKNNSYLGADILECANDYKAARNSYK